jgi:hypothetical protein
LTAIARLGFSGAALAQADNDGQCARLQQIVNSPLPAIGAFALLEHAVAVLKSAIVASRHSLHCGVERLEIGESEGAI